MQKLTQELQTADPSTGSGEDLKALAAPLEKAIGALAETSQFIGMTAMGDLRKAVACSVPYLKLWGITAGGWQMARAALVAAQKLAAGDAEADFYKAKIATARFYASHVLTQSAYLKRQIVDGSGDVMALSEAQFDLDRKATVIA
jgi:butyryl-CoA dehydrogenase